MKRIDFFEEKEPVLLGEIRVRGEKGELLKSAGICEGVRAEIFLKDKENMILKVGEMKIGLSENVYGKIFALPIA